MTPRRFERPTYRVGICRSILLSYGIISQRNQSFGGIWRNVIFGCIQGAGEGTVEGIAGVF